MNCLDVDGEPIHGIESLSRKWEGHRGVVLWTVEGVGKVVGNLLHSHWDLMVESLGIYPARPVVNSVLLPISGIGCISDED